MTNELSNNFDILNDDEMRQVDGGLVFTAAFIGCCFVWGVNAGLLTYALKDMANDKK